MEKNSTIYPEHIDEMEFYDEALRISPRNENIFRLHTLLF